MASIRKVDLMDIHPDKNVCPKKPDYYIQRKGYYYNRGIYTYDLLLDGKYYGTVQVKIKGSLKALMVRAKKVFPLLRKVKKERITFLLFGECGVRFVGDPVAKVKVRKTEKPTSAMRHPDGMKR